jgi:hypothetical protein
MLQQGKEQAGEPLEDLIENCVSSHGGLVKNTSRLSH